jgi:hypothetical protein
VEFAAVSGASQAAVFGRRGGDSKGQRLSGALKLLFGERLAQTGVGALGFYLVFGLRRLARWCRRLQPAFVLVSKIISVF